MRSHMLSALFIAGMLLSQGCGKQQAVSQPELFHGGAVLIVEADSDKGESPVEKNFKVGPDGKPVAYGGGVGLLNGNLKIQYQFVGTAFCQYRHDPDDWNYADVYVISITKPDRPVETIPFVYKGGRQVVVQREALRIEMSQQTAN